MYIRKPAFILLLFLAACKPSLEERIVASAYPDAVGEIMLTNCATEGCHAAEAPEAGLDLSTWSALMKGSDFGAMAIPGSDQWSHLFQHVNTFDDLGIRAQPVMPPDSVGTLTRAQIVTIQDWVQEGAKDRSGLNYWAAQEQRSNGKVFALCAGSDLIAVSDIATNRLMRMIPVGQYPLDLEAPHYLTLSPDKQYLYLSLINGGLIEKYRTDTYAFVGRVAVGPDPSLIVLNADGTRAIVTHWNDSDNQPKLTLLNTETLTIIDEIVAGGSFMSFPHGVKASSDFRTLYVGSNQGNYISRLEIDETGFLNEEKILLDPVNDPVERSTQDYQPYQLFLSPDESRLFVTLNKKNEVWVLNTANKEVLARIPVGKAPRLMAYDPASQRIFVACKLEENFTEQGSLQGCVSVIDAGNLQFVQNIYRVGHRPHGVSIAQNSRMLYVSSENTGGADTPHHPTTGNSSPPGKYNIVDLSTLKSIKSKEVQIAEFPSALIVSE